MQKIQKMFFMAFLFMVSGIFAMNHQAFAETWKASQSSPEKAVKTYFYASGQQRFDLVYDSITEYYAKKIGVVSRPPTREGDSDKFEIPPAMLLDIKGVYEVAEGREDVDYDVLVFYDFITPESNLKNLVAPVVKEGGDWKVTVPSPEDKYFIKLMPGAESVQAVIDMLESTGELKLKKIG